MVSLWPGLVLTERTRAARAALPDSALPALDWAGAESQRFTGRAVVALACDPDALRRSGRAFPSRQLALDYGFRDVDGALPDGPIHRTPPGGET